MIGDKAVRGQGCIDGAASLREAAVLAERFAGQLRELDAKGYRLRRPIAGDYGWLYLAPAYRTTQRAVAEAADIITRRVMEAIASSPDAADMRAAAEKAAEEIRQLWTLAEQKEASGEAARTADSV